MAWIPSWCGYGIGQQLQLIEPLACEPPYAVKKKKAKKKKAKKKNKKVLDGAVKIIHFIN